MFTFHISGPHGFKTESVSVALKWLDPARCIGIRLNGVAYGLLVMGKDGKVSIEKF